MNESQRPETLSGCRAEARRLLHDLSCATPERAQAAAARFARLTSLCARGSAGVLAARATIRLKHALAVVAEERGAPSWTALKRRLENAPPPSFYTPRLASLLNRWFADYDAARASLAELGGFLLPYRTQFLITESEGVRELGLDPNDPDWAAVGFDLARPCDAAAFDRLCALRRAALQRAAADGRPEVRP